MLKVKAKQSFSDSTLGIVRLGETISVDKETMARVVSLVDVIEQEEEPKAEPKKKTVAKKTTKKNSPQEK